MANLNVNSGTWAGNITSEPRYNEEYNILNFSLACNNPYQDKDGEWQNDPLFIDIVVAGQQAKWAKDKLHAKDNVYVTGSLKNNSYKNKDGIDCKTIRVNAQSVKLVTSFSDKVDKSENTDAEPRKSSGKNEKQGTKSSSPKSNQGTTVEENDIPF